MSQYREPKPSAAPATIDACFRLFALAPSCVPPCICPTPTTLLSLVPSRLLRPHSTSVSSIFYQTSSEGGAEAPADAVQEAAPRRQRLAMTMPLVNEALQGVKRDLAMEAVQARGERAPKQHKRANPVADAAIVDVLKHKVV